MWLHRGVLMIMKQASIESKDEDVVEDIYQINQYYCKQKVGDVRLMGMLFRGTIREEMGKGNLLHVVDNEYGDVVGFALFEKLKKSMVLNLDKLAVVDGFRGCGIGTDLLNMVKDVANKENRIIRVKVSKVNVLALEFYIKRDFKRVGMRDYMIIMEWMHVVDDNKGKEGQMRLSGVI